MIYLQKDQQRYEAEQQVKNNEFQKQLVELQAESELATININTDHGAWAEAFEITNDGSAVAKNLRIVLYINNINEIWASTLPLSDVNQFLVEPTDLSINYSMNQVPMSKYGGDSSPFSGNNAVLITIDNLPPGKKVGFLVMMAFLYDPENSINEFSFNREIHIAIPQYIILSLPNLTIENYVQDTISGYRESVFRMANASLNVSCDNCKENGTYTNLDIFLPGSIQTTDFIIESETNTFVKVKTNVELSYRGTNALETPKTPLYLEVLTMLGGKPVTASDGISQQEYDRLK